MAQKSRAESKPLTKLRKGVTKRLRRTLDALNMQPVEMADTVEDDEEEGTVNERKKNSNNSTVPRKPPVTKKKSSRSKAPRMPASQDDPAEDEISLKFVNWALGMQENEFRKFFDELSKYAPPETFTSNAFREDANRAKNRSQDVICLDNTRVKMPIDEEYTSDYIHANYVELNPSKKCIVAQYPLANTAEDFWRMVFVENVDRIVAICNIQTDSELGNIDGKKVAPVSVTKEQLELTKSTRTASMRMQIEPSSQIAYWPLDEGQFAYYGKYFVNTRKVEPPQRNNFPTVYTIEVLPAGCADSIFLKLHNFSQWPKEKCPPSIGSFMRLRKIIEGDGGPADTNAVVHCDLGVDRSASLVFVSQLVSKMFKQKKPVDFPQMFKSLRNARAGALQTYHHFVYVIYSITKYIENRKTGAELTKKNKELQDATLKIIDNIK